MTSTQKVVAVATLLLALVVFGLQSQGIAMLKERTDRGIVATGPASNPGSLFGNRPTVSSADVNSYNALLADYERAVGRRTGFVISILVLGGIALLVLREDKAHSQPDAD